MRHNLSTARTIEVDDERRGIEAAHALIDASNSTAALLKDIAEARHVLGRTDHVTLLPNRIRLFEDLDQSYGQGNQRLVLVTLSEAGKYNGILRALGYCFADEFVRLGSQKILEFLPDGCELYHVGVLSFAFLLPAHRVEETTNLVPQLLRSFAIPLSCRGLPIETKIGIGLLDFDIEITGPAEALRSALGAAQESRTHACGYAFYNRKSDQAHLRAFTILRDLERGLQSEGQFSLHYQPKVDLATGRCNASEALIRWTHPELGVISPAEFIPLVEATALITPMTDWVLRQSFDQMAKWKAMGLDLKLSINVSPSNFSEPHFFDGLKGLTRTAGVRPDSIELEFTEGQMMANGADVPARLEELRNDGYGLAIDDFGTGYCNLSYLSRLPANVIKIDQSLVRSIETNDQTRLLLSLIVSLVRNLDYKIVAEGIETGAAYDIVRDLGCDQGQGYFMSKPLTARAFESWLAAR